MAFNEDVQFDLLFYRGRLGAKLGGAHGVPIIHLIDCCIRWSACLKPQSKTILDLFDGISLAWVDVFGGMRVLTFDGETGIRGNEVDDRAMYTHII